MEQKKYIVTVSNATVAVFIGHLTANMQTRFLRQNKQLNKDMNINSYKTFINSHTSYQMSHLHIWACMESERVRVSEHVWELRVCRCLIGNIYTSLFHSWRHNEQQPVWSPRATPAILRLPQAEGLSPSSGPPHSSSSLPTSGCAWCFSLHGWVRIFCLFPLEAECFSIRPILKLWAGVLTCDLEGDLHLAKVLLEQVPTIIPA